MATKKKKKPFDDKALFTWLRSGLRSMSRRYQPIYEALAAAKEPYNGPNARQKVAYRCACCGNLFSAKEVAVDHRIDCGKLTCWDDVRGFMERLFCSKDGLDVLCSRCHDRKTYASKHGVSLEEADLQKNVLAFIKGKTTKQLVALLLKMGYTSNEVSNATKRRTAVEELFRNGTLK